jgi:hypothetical protein
MHILAENAQGTWICVGIGAVLLLVLLASASSSKCGVCGNSIKRKAFVWRVDGKKVRMCPKCNSQMESRQSKRAFKNRFG